MNIDLILVTDVVLAALGLSLLLTFVRVLRGPSLPDRVVGLETMALLLVGIIAAYSVAIDQPVLIDAAFAVALVTFLGTVAFCLYIEKRGIE